MDCKTIYLHNKHSAIYTSLDIEVCKWWAQELCQAKRSTVGVCHTPVIQVQGIPSFPSLLLYLDKKPTLGHLQLESNYNGFQTHNSFCVRYSAKSHFTLSDRVLWDSNIIFPLCFGTTSVSSKGPNMNFHPQSLPQIDLSVCLYLVFF